MGQTKVNQKGCDPGMLENCYKSPTELFVVDQDKNKEIIHGGEGATQGDPCAMAMYSISIHFLVQHLAVNQDPLLPPAKQAWFADGRMMALVAEVSFSLRKCGTMCWTWVQSLVTSQKQANLFYMGICCIVCNN